MAPATPLAVAPCFRKSKKKSNQRVHFARKDQDQIHHIEGITHYYWLDLPPPTYDENGHPIYQITQEYILTERRRLDLHQLYALGEEAGYCPSFTTTVPSTEILNCPEEFDPPRSTRPAPKVVTQPCAALPSTSHLYQQSQWSPELVWAKIEESNRSMIKPVISLETTASLHLS